LSSKKGTPPYPKNKNVDFVSVVSVSKQEGTGAKSLVMVPQLKEANTSDLVSVLAIATMGSSVTRFGC
jgi:hypothetical protein